MPTAAEPEIHAFAYAAFVALTFHHQDTRPPDNHRKQPPVMLKSPHQQCTSSCAYLWRPSLSLLQLLLRRSPLLLLPASPLTLLLLLLLLLALQRMSCG
jgi:hypothetical protein